MDPSNSPEYDSMFEDDVEESSMQKRNEIIEESTSSCDGCTLDTEYDSIINDYTTNRLENSMDNSYTEYWNDSLKSNEVDTSVAAVVDTKTGICGQDRKVADLLDRNYSCKQIQHKACDTEISIAAPQLPRCSKPGKRTFSSLVSIIQNQKKAPTTLISTTTPVDDVLLHSAPTSKLYATETIQPCMNSFISVENTSSYSNDEWPIIHMGYFWEAMLSWDILQDLNSYIQRSAPQISKAAKITQSSTAYTVSKPLFMSDDHRMMKPLPNQFDSPQQYKALWGPLHILEVKSQIFSQITMDASTTTAFIPSVIPVTISNMKMDHRVSHRIVLTLKYSSSRHRDSSSSRNDFTLNEWVLLSSDSMALERAFRGNFDSNSQASQNPNASNINFSTSDPSPFVGNRKAIVALVSSERSRTPDGLKLSVLDHLIRPFNISTTTEIYLLRLGSNITAVREFNALSDFENLPLMKYILKNPSPTDPNYDKSMLLTTGNKRDENNPLARGGKDGLGIGFRIFINSKFNASQKEAIIAAATEYGGGGFTLVKGPPGSGKTTTLIAIINALHLRQYQRYYSEVENVTKHSDSVEHLMLSARFKPRILVCAPSNAAVDYVVSKIIKDRFIDGNGGKYNPSILRVGSGLSTSVSLVSLQSKVDSTIKGCTNIENTRVSMEECQKEMARIDEEIFNLQKRIRALITSCPYKVGKDWEARIDEKTFYDTGRVIFVNHKSKSASLQCPPSPSTDEEITFLEDMPHYRSCMDLLVKFVERRCNQCSKLDLLKIINNALENNLSQSLDFLQQMETKIIDSTDIILTTLGSSGSRSMEFAKGFEVIVIDEAAQSSEISSLTALQLGSSHAILVGDPQQLPATIFSMTGRFTRFDRSLFQRLEESGHVVHTLNTQYRCHPVISSFPRRMFYDGSLLDGPNVVKSDYGGPLRTAIELKFPKLQPLTIFDLNSTEERENTSLSNIEEAHFALHLFCSLNDSTNGILLEQRFVCVITPYSQQVTLLNKIFQEKLGHHFSRGLIEIKTIDSFQGNEREIVIFSAVRAANKVGGIGFLNDVRRMNVALTRAKHYLFVIASCNTIIVNPYWRDFISYTQEHQGVLKVEKLSRTYQGTIHFPEINTLEIVIRTRPTPEATTKVPPPPPSRTSNRSNKNHSKKRKSKQHKTVLVCKNNKKIDASSNIGMIAPKNEDICVKTQVLATKFKKIYQKKNE